MENRGKSKAMRGRGRGRNKSRQLRQPNFYRLEMYQPLPPPPPDYYYQTQQSSYPSHTQYYYSYRDQEMNDEFMHFKLLITVTAKKKMTMMIPL